MERIILKARVDGIDFAAPITIVADIATAVWVPQPVTLRDDEVSVIEDDPQTYEIVSHENDAPEDFEVAGSGIRAVGSFIKATFAQMVTLMGGSLNGSGTTSMYLHSTRKTTLNKAVRFRLKDGSQLILPNAKGSVQLSAKVGYDGLLKYPFMFRSLAQSTMDADFIIIQYGQVLPVYILSISPTTLNVPAEGGTYTFTVASTADGANTAYTVTAPSFVTITQQTATGFKATFAPNTGNQSRPGDITIRQTVSGKTAKATGTQAGVEISNAITDESGNVLTDESGNILEFVE